MASGKSAAVIGSPVSERRSILGYPQPQAGFASELASGRVEPGIDQSGGCEMALILAAIALVVVAAAYVYLRDRKPKRSAAEETGSFHAVSIRIDKRSACDAARKISRRRFLSDAPPRLPLPECTASNCRCRFERHTDRRAGARRASETGTFEPLFGGDDQREESRGRRAEDRGERPVATDPADQDPSSSYYDYISESGRHKKLEED